MELVSKGYTSKQIARALGISPSTVDNHVRAVTVQLGARGRLEAARMALQSIKDKETDRPRQGPEEKDHNGIDEPAPDASEPFPLMVFPPFGGYRNRMPIWQRFVHIMQIALAGTMVFAALTASIAGIVQLLSQ